MVDHHDVGTLNCHHRFEFAIAQMVEEPDRVLVLSGGDRVERGEEHAVELVECGPEVVGVEVHEAHESVVVVPLRDRQPFDQCSAGGLVVGP